MFDNSRDRAAAAAPGQLAVGACCVDVDAPCLRFACWHPAAAALPPVLPCMHTFTPQAEEGASNLERMLKAQEKDPLLGPIMRGWRMARDAVSSALEPSEQPQEQQLLEPEPEWKVAKRQREEARQLEQRMQELQAAFEQQREEQRQQQWFWRRWFGKQ